MSDRFSKGPVLLTVTVLNCLEHREEGGAWIQCVSNLEPVRLRLEGTMLDQPPLKSRFALDVFISDAGSGARIAHKIVSRSSNSTLDESVISEICSVLLPYDDDFVRVCLRRQMALAFEKGIQEGTVGMHFARRSLDNMERFVEHMLAKHRENRIGRYQMEAVVRGLDGESWFEIARSRVLALHVIDKGTILGL